MNQIEICPKCDKIKLTDAFECPYCGVIYSKFKPIQSQTPKIETNQDEPSKKTYNYRNLIAEYYFSLLFVSTIVLFYFSREMGAISFLLLIIIAVLKFKIKPNDQKNRYIITVPEDYKSFPDPEPQPERSFEYRFISEYMPDITIKIKSSSMDIEYLVNPKNQTCNCPDFAEYRSQYEFGDVQRFCKHIIQAFGKKNVSPFVPDHIKPLIESARKRGKGSYRGESLKYFYIRKKIVLFSTNNRNGWVNVYAESCDHYYQRFGYNTDEKRWSYDEVPLHSKKIITRIVE